MWSSKQQSTHRFHQDKISCFSLILCYSILIRPSSAYLLPSVMRNLLGQQNIGLISKVSLWANQNSNYVNNKNRRRREKSDDVLYIEKDLTDRGYFPIIGSDESGRGCIAGPVIAASCCILQDWSEYTPIEGVGDSKTLTQDERERIYKNVVDQPHIYAWEVGIRSNTQIDESNILLAAMECFSESIEKLTISLPETHNNNPYSIVDGKKSPKLSVKIPCRPWVKADAEVYTVALASIIAKVTRDRLAMQWHESYPEYGFDVHKGYATTEHIEALHTYGPCPLHRMSFKSLKGR